MTDISKSNTNLVRLALKQPLRQSSCKLLLATLSAHAEPSGIVSPLYIQDLIKLTSLDRKTVIRGLKKLQDENYIKDTGSRFGDTNQGKIYRLLTESEPGKHALTPGPIKVIPVTPADSIKVNITISVESGQVSVS